MLIDTTYKDVPTKLDPNGRPIRFLVITPNVPNYPNAKFPGTSLSSTISFLRISLTRSTQSAQALSCSGQEPSPIRQTLDLSKSPIAPY